MLAFDFQECRAAGCRTLAEAKTYIEQKRKKEIEANAQKAKESGQALLSTKGVQKTGRPAKVESDGSPRNSVDPKIKGSVGLDSGGKDSPTAMGLINTKSWDDWDITGVPGAELLSETVRTFGLAH